MRVLHVVPCFSPRMGGSARVVHDTARHLTRRGLDVTVVAGDHRQEEARFPRDEFEQVLLRSVLSRWGFYYTPGLVPWMRERAAEFDVIHLHEVRTFQNVVARRGARRCGVPYVLSAHGTLPVIIQRRLAKRAYDLLFGRALLAGAARLLAVSPTEVEQYRQWGVEPGRIELVYNGLDLEEFAHLPPRGLLRHRLGIGRDAPLVLFLGRLHRIKGLGHLLEAFARLREGLGDAVLVIAGPDWGEQSSLEELAGRLRLGAQVRFTGPVWGEDKLAAYVDADVVAAPAAYEIFGLVPFEALMCGTPVVVADGCGSGRLIADAQAGYLVPYGDVAALAAALHRALTDRAEARAKVAAGQAFVREHLDWRAIAARLEGVYEEVADEGSR